MQRISFHIPDYLKTDNNPFGFYKIPKMQFGGTFDLGYFQDLVPKIFGFQGTTNGTSNLYSPEAQDYYNNLLNLNSSLSGPIDEYFTDDNPVTLHDYSELNNELGTNLNNIEMGYNTYLENHQNQMDQFKADLESGNLSFSDTVDTMRKYKEYKEGDYANKFKDLANRQFNQHRAGALAETGANIFSLMKGQQAYDSAPKLNLTPQSTGHSGFRYAQHGGGDFSKMFDPQTADLTMQYYYTKVKNPFEDE